MNRCENCGGQGAIECPGCKVLLSYIKSSNITLQNENVVSFQRKSIQQQKIQLNLTSAV